MKEVTIDGVEYTSVSSLAKQFRYTTDYIGQLCRAKKVDAKLVGRTWYVNVISLTNHKKAKYKKALPSEKTKEIPIETTLSRTDVDPQIFVSKHHKAAGGPTPNFARRIDWGPLKYESDEVELLPKISRPEAFPHKIKINLAEATLISVKNSSQNTKMVSEDLPTVSLKGKLKIESLNDVYLDDVEQPVPDMVSLDMVLQETNNTFKNKAIISKKQTPPSLSHIHNYKLNKSRVSLIPTNLTRTRTSVEIVSTPESKSGRKAEILLFASATILTGCLFLILFGELNLFARPGFYKWELAFSTESLAALASLFSL